MRVHLPRLAVNPWVDLPVDVFERVAAVDRFREHQLVDDPEDADLVLFTQCHMVDWRLRAIRESAVARAHWKKVMVYDERDRPWLSFPGVYVSATRASFDARRQRAWSYVRVEPVPAEPVSEPDLLFSFVGSSTAECRARLFELRHPEAVVEEVRDFMYWDAGDERSQRLRRRFAGVLARSRFVLCPRGRGTSSIRLYETLAAGRVPVIVSDGWIEPEGPDWDACSVRVGESEIDRLPEVLEERDQDWEAMSRAATATYRDFFCDEVAFHRIIETAGDLGRLRPARSPRRRLQLRAAAASLRESLRCLPIPAGGG